MRCGAPLEGRIMSDKQEVQLSTTVKKFTGGSGGTKKATKAVVADDAEPYTAKEIGEAVEYAKPFIVKVKKKRGEAASGHMATYLNKLRPFNEAGYPSLNALTWACQEWFDKPSTFEEKQAKVARNPLINPTITYGATHGDLHFIDKPTTKKSAWTLGKSAALSLMEAEIRKFLGPLGTHSDKEESSQGWSTFYVSGQHTTHVGAYKETGKRVDPTTAYFSMQVQVKYADNEISYHGYPDEKMEGNAKLGCKKTLFGAPLT
jgi:hypothetical protein